MEKIRLLLKKHNQSHLLTFLEKLSSVQKEKLFSQIKKLDFKRIPEWIDNLVKNHSTEALPSNFKPVDYYPAIPGSSEQKQIYKKAINLGKKLLSEGKVAAFVVAGGQGSRLGFDGPKGNYPISPVKN
ncbi:MAG: hypothetical protein ACYTE8_06805, partial [Planctomycetota bacterium]